MAQSSSKSASRKTNPANFLEAFRELSRETISEAKTQITKIVASDIPQSFGLGSSSGTLSPNESFSMDDLRKAEQSGQQKAENKFDRELQQMRAEERSRLLRQESANKEQLKALQAELKQLVKSAGELSSEVQVATMQATVNPGVYHKNFFAHLRSVIAALRHKVESSKNWLATSNSRAKKQSYFWGSVKKSGTSFLLSSERYMVTSTG